MVDATTSHEALSFMDGSSSYNQIRMDPKDEELTAFQTPKGIYCYKVMPFGLKNAGATYQRAMQKIFNDMLHKNVECYVDDLVVKSKKRVDHLEDLRQVFERLRRYQLRINPLKCAFGVSSRKFLGFIVSHRVIEIDQSKIDAIMKMLEPSNLHELKSLQGRLAYIRGVISNLASRLMKKDTPFVWDESCSNAFKSIKSYLLRPPVSRALTLERLLILYIAVQEHSLGALLAQQNHEGKENVLYYLNFPDEDALYIEIPKPWKLYFDGAARQNGVEYQALIIGSEMAVDMQITQLKVFGDSKLVINQVLTLYEVKKPELLLYVNYVQKLLKWFDKASIEHVPRKENRQADSLANLASAIASPNTELKVHLCKRWIISPITLGEKVDVESNVVSILEVEKEDWPQPLIDYLEHGKLPNDPRHKTEIKCRAP
ncbi:Reverse transcriptase domain - like 10 [Theobroma cacao]|nr:Reverse transcriptase domain - like 10 [Theobroma cacao]